MVCSQPWCVANLGSVDISLTDLSDPAPPPSGADWNAEGVLIVPGMIPDSMIDAYEDEWAVNNGLKMIGSRPDFTGSDVPLITADRVGGYNETAYMVNPALMAICTYKPLADALSFLMEEPAGVHLNLSGWVSTKRDWHADTYLNPDHVGDYYAAVWIALGDVHPDSGPFQYVPGSHRWNRLSYDKIKNHIDVTDPEWPAHSETLLTPLVQEEIVKRGAEVVTYLPKRGDVLIWHSRLYHRGTVPNVEGAYRPALIAHFSGVNHRQDMAPAIQHPVHGGWYFPLGVAAGAHAAMMAREGVS